MRAARQFLIRGIASGLMALGAPSFAVGAEAQKVTLPEVVRQVQNSNYLVLQNALKVYQAKESILLSRRNLLPKLNVWRLLSIPFDPASAIGAVQDIAPFLIPNNWFRVEQDKLLYQAQLHAYRALQSNEVLTAKSLYIHALMDQSLATHIEQARNELKQILEIVRTREILGGAQEGASREIEVRLLALQEDERAIASVIREDKSLIAYLTGKSGAAEIELAPIALPVAETLRPLRYEDYEARMLKASPELSQYAYLISAADYLRKERVFAFLGASTLSQGLSGGVFDDLPAQDGLGFGTGASIRISRAQKQILQLQRNGLAQVLRRNLKLVVENYNADLFNYQSLKERVHLTQGIKDRLYERLSLGDAVDAMELVEASKNHIQADTAYFALQFRLLTTQDRLQRLIFEGDYVKKPLPIGNF